MKKNHILLAFSTLALLHLSAGVWAHSGDKPIRFVSATGTDEGVCNSPSFPCKTIAYAVDQSTKGDIIHVAAGEYQESG